MKNLKVKILEWKLEMFSWQQTKIKSVSWSTKIKNIY